MKENKKNSPEQLREVYSNTVEKSRKKNRKKYRRGVLLACAFPLCSILMLCLNVPSTEYLQVILAVLMLIAGIALFIHTIMKYKYK